MLVDIDPVTFNLHAEGVETLLATAHATPIRALLPVHLYGQCVPWPEFARLKSQHGVTLIEDAAQAWGAKWGEVSAGALGDIAAISFYPTKNLNAPAWNAPTLPSR
jgi:dTDP-4-amino-4,6-dideoxygalactose transaminase